MQCNQKTGARHGGEIFSLSEEERNQLIDFSVNINPIGLSPRGRQAVMQAFDREAGRYPDSSCRALKAALHERYGIPEECLTCGNGATELMYALIRAVRPSIVYVPAPSFSEYCFSAEAADIPVQSFLLDKDHRFLLKNDRFLHTMPMHPLIYLGNPNNPDGQILSKKTFEMVMTAVEQREGWLVIDESFIDFLDDTLSFRNQLAEHPRLVILLSLTKFYSVPGLRIGAAGSSPELAVQLSGQLCPWNVNGPAQLYMTEALKDLIYIRQSRDYVRRERRRMEMVLRTIPQLFVYDGTVNFFLLRLQNGMQGEELSERLRPYHLKVRQCGNYEGLDDTFFRIAVRTESENNRMLSALKEVLMK